MTKTAEYAFKAYFYGVNILPPLIFAILYTVTFSEVESEWSIRCIVDTTKQNKMVENTPWAYSLKKYPTDQSIKDFLLEHPNQYEDITSAYAWLGLFGMLVNFLLFILSVYDCYQFNQATSVLAGSLSLDPEAEPLQGASEQV